MATYPVCHCQLSVSKIQTRLSAQPAHLCTLRKEHKFPTWMLVYLFVLIIDFGYYFEVIIEHMLLFLI